MKINKSTEMQICAKIIKHGILVINCCMTNCHKLSCLKQHIFNLITSEVQNSGSNSLGI